MFFWLVLAMLLANMGFNGFQSFARYFFEVYFPTISPDAAYRTMGGISLVVTMLSAVGAGILSDWIGRRTMILWGVVGCAVSTLLMGFATSFTVFLVLTTIRSIAMGPSWRLRLHWRAISHQKTRLGITWHITIFRPGYPGLYPL